jgi:hypothetical protein
VILYLHVVVLKHKAKFTSILSYLNRLCSCEIDGHCKSSRVDVCIDGCEPSDPTTENFCQLKSISCERKTPWSQIAVQRECLCQIVET